MRRHLLNAAWMAAICCLPRTAAAQQPDTAAYAYPVRGVAGYYSANFGEMRPGHFHSGIDIKTDGAEGKPLVATADGYVARIGVTAGGYGRALYLALDNGMTAVYGHSSRFRDDLEAYVRAERLRLEKNDVQLYPAAERFRVRRGELIAYSGNSGTSYGPHLHFELRETASQRTLNIVRRGIVRPKDDLPPRIVRVHYIETDTLDGIPVHAAPQSYETTPTGPATYRIAAHGPVEAGRNGFFVVEATDRRNDVNNTFGLYRLRIEADGEVLFEYRMDGFTFDQSRYCDVASWYPMQLASRNEAICLALLEGGTDRFCTGVRDRGVLRLAPGEERRMHVEAEDDCGNLSHLEFVVRGREAQFRAEADSTLVPLRYDRPHTLRIGEEAAARIPAGALYESCFARPEIREAHPASDTTVTVLTPAYRFLPRTTPLRHDMTVSIRAYVPPQLRPRATLAVRNDQGRIRFVGGKYADGAVTARTRTTGDLLVAADTVPPTIRPLFKPGEDLSRKRMLRFGIGDNFAGIADCALYIDGQWTPCDRYPVKGQLQVPLFTEPEARRHTLRLLVRDNCGNTAEWTGDFFR